MREITDEQRAGLDAARDLIDSDVPVFVAKPDRATDGTWRPDGGHGGTGYWLPKDWQVTVPDAAVLDTWRPGDALCAVMGHAVDGLDLDPHKGGNLNCTRPTSYGRAGTPSGGTHDLIAPLGVRSRDGVFPGVDVKAGVDGEGHGFLFIAPTLKLSKVTGEVSSYAWEVVPDLSPLLMAADPSGRALRAAIEDKGIVTATASDGPAYDDLTAEQREEADRHVEVTLFDWAARLAGAATWPEGETDADGRGWELLSRDVAWAVAALAATPWAPPLDGQAEFERVMPDVMLANEKCQKWHDGLPAKAAKDVGPPPWQPPVPAAPAASGAGTGTTPLAVRLREVVAARYDVFPAGDDGRIFVQPKGGGRAELLTGGFVIRASQGIGLQAGTLSAAATEAAKVLAAQAEAEQPRPLALRVHARPDRLVLDLAARGNSRCVVVTADGWEVADVPPAGVVFQGSGKPLPDPERGGDVDELRALLRWAADDPRWLLVKGWLPCALLADVPRPLLGLFGPQGSAKSTTGRFVVDLIDPKPRGALGGGFGKNRSDDETKAFATYLVAWDNVSKVSDEGADLLSRLVTGDMIEKRRLYTDAEVSTIVYRRTGVLTGISVPRGVKADTLDRLILLTLEAMEDRLSESVLEAEWERIRPRALAGVLDLAVRMLAGERRNPDGLRMADYAEALWAIDPALYRAYADNVREARADMASNDPFIASIVAWLDDRAGHPWEGTATEALHAAECHRDGDAWWPRTPKGFMDAVTANLELLREAGVDVTERRSGGQKLKRFSLRDWDLM